MSILKKTAYAFFWNYINKIVGFTFDLLLSMILARGLGSYEFGLYAELLNIIIFFSLVCSFGTDTAVNILIPRYINNPIKIAQIIKKALFLIAVTSIFAFLFIVYFKFQISNLLNSPNLKDLLLVAALYIIAYNFLILLQSVLIGLYRTKLLFINNIILKLSFVVFTFLAFLTHKDLAFIIKAFTVFLATIGVVYLYNLRNYIFVKTSKGSFSELLNFGLTAWLIKFLNYFLGRNFDIFIFGVYGISKSDIAYYSITFTLTLAMSYLFTSGFSGVALSAFSGLAQEKKNEGIIEGWILIIKIIILFCTPVFVFSILNAKNIIILLYSNEYVDSASLLTVFASLFLVSMFFGSGTNSAVLFALRKEKVVLILRCVFGALNISFDLILVPKYGAMGAILATGLSTIGIICAEYLSLKKMVNLKYPSNFLLKIIVATIGATFMIQFLSAFKQVYFIYSVVVYLLTYIVLLFLLKPFIKKDAELISKVYPQLYRYLLMFVK